MVYNMVIQMAIWPHSATMKGTSFSGFCRPFGDENSEAAGSTFLMYVL